MRYSIFTNTVHITTRAYMHTVVLWSVQNGQMIVPRGVPNAGNEFGLELFCYPADQPWWFGVLISMYGEVRRTNGKWKQTEAVGSGCFFLVGGGLDCWSIGVVVRDFKTFWFPAEAHLFWCTKDMVLCHRLTECIRGSDCSLWVVLPGSSATRPGWRGMRVRPPKPNF